MRKVSTTGLELRKVRVEVEGCVCGGGENEVDSVSHMENLRF